LHNFSLRQAVRFCVPNFCLDAASSVDHGRVEEKNADSAARACSQVIPEFIACELGHLTQNQVVSSRSPRMNGSQLSSSVAGIRSGFVNTPGNRPLLMASQRTCPCQHTNRLLARRIKLFSQPMCTLVHEIRYIALSEGFQNFKVDILSHATVSRIMQLSLSMYDTARSLMSFISSS
jgi:hypothetical protein